MRPKLEILAFEDTPLGPLCLRRRELIGRPGILVTEVTLDHEFLMSSYLTASERALSKLAIDGHGANALSVLIGGLGLGYTAHEALSSERVAQLEVVEYLPQVIGWLERGLLPLSACLNADARLRVVHGDVYARLAVEPARHHDLILIDVDHSPAENLGTGNASFYTEPGLQLAKQHLAPKGILGVWSYAEHSSFADALRQVFRCVRVEPITVTNDLINEEQTDWLFFATD
jgi:spermidine synthase